MIGYKTASLGQVGNEFDVMVVRDDTNQVIYFRLHPSLELAEADFEKQVRTL